MNDERTLSADVYAAIAKAYDHECDIEDAVDEILGPIEADRKRRGEPVAWVAADTLHSPHPGCVSSLAYMSQLDKDRGREYVPLYAYPTPPTATTAPSDMAHEIWAAAQLVPGEGIVDGAARVEALLARYGRHAGDAHPTEVMKAVGCYCKCRDS